MVKKRIISMLEKGTLTRFELISIVFSFLSLVALVIGLSPIFIIYRQTSEISQQTRNSALSLENSVYQTITTQEMEFDRLFVENPKLRPYFFSGLEIKEGDPDYAKAESIADYELDFFDSAKGRLRLLERVGYDANMTAWDRYIDDSFANSPILCKRLERLGAWYGESLNRELDVCKRASKSATKAPQGL